MAHHVADIQDLRRYWQRDSLARVDRAIGALDMEVEAGHGCTADYVQAVVNVTIVLVGLRSFHSAIRC